MKHTLLATCILASAGILTTAPEASAETQIVHVRAWIDGRSELILHGSSVQWQHFDFAAPGRLDCDIGVPQEPTTIDANVWYPVWPDLPTCENRSCGGCTSDVADMIFPPLPINEFFARLVPWGGGSGDLSVIEQPHAGNNYRAVIEFNDSAFGGASWYEFDLYVEPCFSDAYCTSTPNSSNFSASLVVGGDLSLTGPGAMLWAFQCAPQRPGIFFYGTHPANMPLANGRLCIDPFSGIHRMHAMWTDQDGVAFYSLDFPNLPFTSDTTYYFQYWFRDPAGGGTGSNLTDAVRVRFCP